MIGFTQGLSNVPPLWFGVKGWEAEKIGESIFLKIGIAEYSKGREERGTRVYGTVLDGFPDLEAVSRQRRDKASKWMAIHTVRPAWLSTADLSRAL